MFAVKNANKREKKALLTNAYICMKEVTFVFLFSFFSHLL